MPLYGDMTERSALEPSAAHPITIEPTGAHVTVRIGGDIVAETDAALSLREASYPPSAVHSDRRCGRTTGPQ